MNKRFAKVVPEDATGTCNEPTRSSNLQPPLCVDLLDDSRKVEAIQEVASLLAVAYLRYQKIQRVPVDPPTDSVNRELAIVSGQSVHGGDR